MTTPTRDDLVEYATGLIHAARRPGSQIASSTIARVIVNTILDAVTNDGNRESVVVDAELDGDVIDAEVVETLDQILAAADPLRRAFPVRRDTPAPGLSSWERAEVARFDAAPCAVCVPEGHRLVES